MAHETDADGAPEQVGSVRPVLQGPCLHLIDLNLSQQIWFSLEHLTVDGVFLGSRFPTTTTTATAKKQINVQSSLEPIAVCTLLVDSLLAYFQKAISFEFQNSFSDRG